MQAIARFPFVDLSTELVLLILTFAARPDFAQTDEDMMERNPYSYALALCGVSRTVRRAVLPELLHTVLLSEDKNVKSFVHALRMQKAHHRQGNHLYFVYAAHVRRVWVGEICAPPPAAPIYNSFPHHAPVRYTAEPDIDFSVLAPVVLGAESLALNFASLFLLCGCLEHAWSTHVVMNTHTKCSPPPWSVESLALSGEVTRWLPLTSTAEGSAFLASISHLIFLSPTQYSPIVFSTPDPCLISLRSRGFKFPQWITSVPLDSFKSIQTVSLPFPHVVNPADGRLLDGSDMHVEVLTMSGPSGNPDWVPKNLNSYQQRPSAAQVQGDGGMKMPNHGKSQYSMSK
ncbi:hypothetical protein M405DRAFT_882577 [Rhizopogon salebrosus TDB-379]|nr:hypothetical protein M405DRAFT_882577 [Rhizopogon salebrosus TDB-379]